MVKNPPANAGYMGSIPGLGRLPMCHGAINPVHHNSGACVLEPVLWDKRCHHDENSSF